MKTVPIWEIHALSHEVERRCARQGLNVTFCEDAHTAYTNASGDVVFPALKMPMTQVQLIKLKHYMIHEPIHQTRPQCFAIAKRENLDMSSPLGAIFNILEDNIMEHEWSELWVGDKHDIAASTALHDLDWSTNLDSSQELNGDTRVIYAAILLAKLGRMSWDSVGVSLTPTLIKRFDTAAPEVSNLVRKYATKWTPILSNIYEPEEVYEYAVELYNDLLDGKPPEETSKDDIQEAMSNGSATSEHDGEQDQSQAGKPQAGDPQAGDAQAGGEAGDEAGTQPAETGQGSGQVVTFMDDARMQELAPADYAGDEATSCRTVAKPSGTANKLRKALQVATRSHVNTERQSGKIHNANLSRIAMPLVGNGEWNSRIFKNRRRVKKSLDTCVTVLVDCSGSMVGHKIDIASAVSQEVMHTLAELRVPCEILGFGCDNRSSQAYNGLLKSFSERLTSERLVKRFNQFFGKAGGRNHDADALMWAAQRTLARKEKRKILMVLSDGSPSASAKGRFKTPELMLKAVTDDLRQHPALDVYGIGIQDSSVKKFYGENAQVVTDTNKLSDVVLNTLKEGLLK
jgi:Mg-chelatase subunit ChlD